MARSKLPEDVERQLNEYKTVVLTQKDKLVRVLGTHQFLMQKRRGLVQARKLDAEKRAEWNRLAAEWRATKKRVLDEATAAHAPHYRLILPVVGTLTGTVQYIFLRQLQTINGYYTDADAKLRASELVDL